MVKIDTAKLKKLRGSKNLTQLEVSNALGYETSLGYHHIESGKTALRADQAYLLAKIFGVDMEELFFAQNISGVETCPMKLFQG